MKKIILLIIGLCITVITQALTVVSTAGGLSTAITNAGGNISTVDTLTISGVIDARDFKKMRDNMPALIFIDLSNVTIAAYTGSAGTAGSTSINYIANAIPLNAFENNTKITLINFPLSATTINDYAFNGCWGLKTITFPPSITKIRQFAFSYCIGLKTVSIPLTVTNIGSNAFMSCTGLTSATTPRIVGWFDYCTSLKTVIIPEGTTYISDNSFYNCNKLTSIKIPASVTTIGKSAFYGCMNAIFSNDFTSVNSIQDSAFLNCGKLTSIDAQSITSIGKAAFWGCGNLTSLSLSSIVDFIGIDAFKYCTGITTVTMPFTQMEVPLTTTSYNVLSGCSNLNTIYIPSTTDSIKRGAFVDINTAKSLIIPLSVNSINGLAFSGCINLTSIYANATTPVDLSLNGGWHSFPDGIKSTCVLHVPIGTKSLYQSAFEWKDFLNIVEDIPTNIKNTNITNITIKSKAGEIIVTNAPLNQKLTVYNLQGIIVYNQYINQNEITLKLPLHSIYIVKIGNERKKIFIN